jgi:LAS superfamily LD-carboxypeptidase LdcB
LNPLELTGRTRTHVVQPEGLHCALHRDAVDAFLAMRAAAAQAGIELEAASAFRHFDRQREIWNAKFRGERPVLDARGQPLEVTAMDEAARVQAILAWTALPGGSRHHWGTDIDVIDRAAMAPGYAVQLTSAEYAPDGVFGRLAGWLDGNMGRYGFFRPYATGAGGVRPEAWHLSFAPVSRPALRELDVATLADALLGQGVAGETEILARLPAIHARYVKTVDRAPRMRSRWARLRHPV